MSSITPIVLTKRYAEPSAANESAGVSLGSSSCFVQSGNSAFKKFAAIKTCEDPARLDKLSAEYVSAYVEDLHQFLLWKLFSYESQSLVPLPESFKYYPIDASCFSADFFEEFESWRVPSSDSEEPLMRRRMIFDVIKEGVAEINGPGSIVYLPGEESGPLSLHIGRRSERLCISFANFVSRVDKIAKDKIFPKELTEFLKIDEIPPLKRGNYRAFVKKRFEDYLFDITAKNVVAQSVEEDKNVHKVIESIMENEEAFSFLSGYLGEVEECRRNVAQASSKEEFQFFKSKEAELFNFLYMRLLSIVKDVSTEEVELLFAQFEV